MLNLSHSQSKRKISDLPRSARQIYLPDGWYFVSDINAGCGCCDLLCSDPIFGWTPCKAFIEEYNCSDESCVFIKGIY